MMKELEDGNFYVFKNLIRVECWTFESRKLANYRRICDKKFKDFENYIGFNENEVIKK